MQPVYLNIMAANDEDASNISLHDSIICTLCLKESSKYTCPRCNIRYCSVACYRGDKHMSCSEAFYKDCVLDEIKDIRSSPEERQQMLEMLSRTEDGFRELDSDEEEDLEDRMAGLDLDKDTDAIWRRLTQKEREDFQAMVKDGRLANLLEVWTPWWTHRDKEIITEVGSESEKTAVPAVLSSITDINILIKNGRPSSDVKFGVVSALFAYAYVLRLHNGDYMNTAVDTAQDLLSVSNALSSTKTLATVGEAIHGCMTSINKNLTDREKSPQFMVSVIEDVRKMIEGPSPSSPLVYVMASLSDLCGVFKVAKKRLSKEVRTGGTNSRGCDQKAFKTRLFHAEKKVLFFLSWCQRFGMALHGLILELELEFCSLSSELSKVTETKEKFEQSWGGTSRPPEKHNLIEELTST